MAAALVALFAWSVLAANVGLGASTGIACGWQPMPDGSHCYECVVQVTPDLLHSLKQGDSIPLSVEVPEHVKPISRIRLVVGTGSVPQQTLATNLKAWPASDKQSLEGVVETQYTTTNDANRYHTPQATHGAVVPVNGALGNAADAFAQPLNQGGQAVREAVGQLTQDVLPPDPGRGIANAVDRASEQLGANLRSASDTVRSDIRELFGDEPSAAGRSEILPPSGSNNQAVQPILPADSGNTAGTRRRLDQPISPNQENSWQSSQPAGTHAPITPPDSVNRQWLDSASNPHSPAAQNPNPSAQLGDRYGAIPPSGFSNPITPPADNTPGTYPADRRDTTPHASADELSSADARNSAGRSANSGPTFPPFTPTVGNEPVTPTPTTSQTPEIRRDMLSQPADAAIQGANGLPVGQQPVGQPPTVVQAQPQSTPSANDFSWDTAPQSQPSALPSASAPTSVFPLLLSWVLLSGSGAGNLYLFWSYLDVRTKYRDLVDEASQRISGRRRRD